MSEQLLLDPKEIIHGHWHVSGTRKYDAIIQLLREANCPLTIGVHDSDEVILRLSNMLPQCEVVYADVAYDMNVFIVPVLSASLAQHYHEQVPVGTALYTLAMWEPKTEHDRVIADRLTVSDGKLQGIIRYKGGTTE